MKNKLLISFHLFNLLVFGFVINIYGQSQKGLDIDGKDTNDRSGYSVCMPNANMVAIGATFNSDSCVRCGHVRVFIWNGLNWVQKGNDINGKYEDEEFGVSISMPDENTVAISAPLNFTNVLSAGQVRIYSWNGTTWKQKGNSITGEAAYDRSGYSITMPDSNTIGIGAHFNCENGKYSGHARIYSWNGIEWIQKGLDIDGKNAYDELGRSVCMPDSNTIAIGAPKNSDNGKFSGHVRIFRWNGIRWEQKGTDIYGEMSEDQSGISVSMPDTNTIAIGASLNDGNGTNAGQVRVYTWNGNSWIQKGFDIDGEAMYDYSGEALCMPNENTVAIGAHNNSGNGTGSGHVRIYKWNGQNWMQKGIDIDGEGENDMSGRSVFMPDTNTIAIGASLNDGNGTNAGHVRIYSFNNVSIQQFNPVNNIKIYPNPNSGNFYLDLGALYKDIIVIVRTELGQEINRLFYWNLSAMQIKIDGDPGVYYVDIIVDNRKTVIKLLLE